jgi:uncharacterized glyoxalase superfamily protein PhnB
MKHKSTMSALLVISLALVIGTAFTAARTGRERTVMIRKSTPVLLVKNIEPSLKFWTERFGFKKTIEVPDGDHLGFVAIDSGNVELMYQTVASMKADPSNPRAIDQGPTYLFMEVPDINAVSAALNGAEIVKPLHDSSYGAKEIVAKEPGGHFVIFSQLPQH